MSIRREKKATFWPCRTACISAFFHSLRSVYCLVFALQLTLFSFFFFFLLVYFVLFLLVWWFRTRSPFNQMPNLRFEERNEKKQRFQFSFLMRRVFHLFAFNTLRFCFYFSSIHFTRRSYGRKEFRIFCFRYSNEQLHEFRSSSAALADSCIL